MLQNKVVMRFGVMLVITSMIVSWIAVPKAKAVAVVDDVAVGAAATAAYLTSTGIPLTVTSGGAAAASAGIAAAAGEYAAATGVAASGAAFLGSLATGIAIAGGCIIVGATAAVALSAFADWLHTTYLNDSASVQIYNTTHVSGSNFGFSSFIKAGADGFEPTGTCIGWGQTVDLPNGSWISLGAKSGSTQLSWYDATTGKGGSSTISRTNDDPDYSFGVWLMISSGLVYRGIYNTVNRYVANFIDMPTSLFGDIVVDNVGLTEIEYVPIPEIAPAKQLELDLELPPEIDLYTMPEIVFERVANGELADPASVPNAVTDAEPAVDPSPSPDPDLPYVPPAFDEDNPPEDIDDLGLPDLGYALTTRFPFSIPWDIYRGLKLLKAPARMPKFSVDFFGPISGVVGGWKGSTELVIDFGYYPEMEMIGQICRWTSTLGYCLFLASATKRFIWTA